MSNITDRLNKVLQTINSNTVADVGHKSLISHTPIRTGNARRNTIRQGNRIIANYPYAQKLEDNYSPQTHGQGMVNPTIQDVRDYVFQKSGIRIKI